MARPVVTYDPAASYAVREHDVEYLRIGDRGYLVRVYQPEGAGPFPALLDIHGGAWRGSDRLTDEVVDRALAAAGMVVASIDFRSAPEFPYPAQVQDANYAVRWLKAHAEELGADGTHVGGLGRSSGGHTVFLNALRPRDERYAAIALPEAQDADAGVAYVIALWPVLDSYTRYLIAKENGASHLIDASEGYFLTEAAMREGNPQGMLDRGEQSLLPPTQILHGSADTNVPLHLVERFAEHYRNAGGQLALEVFPGQPHTFAAEAGPLTDQAVALMQDFVAAQVAASYAAT